MKKFVLPFLAVIMLLITVQSEAMNYGDFYQDISCPDERCNFYAEIFGGANYIETQTRKNIKFDFDTGFMVAGTYGYRLCYGFRFEIEYAYRRNPLKKIYFYDISHKFSGRYQSNAAMANLVWDIPFNNYFCTWLFQPFIGGGVGLDYQEIQAKSRRFCCHKKKKQFAWQAVAGIKYPIFCNMNIFAEYRFHKGGFRKFENHTIGGGLTYNFWPLLPCR